MSNLPPLRRISSPSQSASPHSVPTHSDQNNTSTSAAPASTILQLNPQLEPDQETNATSGVIGEPRKCFICLSEEGEESSTEGSPSETARWSKPCACSLDAHEACLITYINRQRKDDPNKTVLSLPPSLLYLDIHLSSGLIADPYRCLVHNVKNRTNSNKTHPFSTAQHPTTTPASQPLHPSSQV